MELKINLRKIVENSPYPAFIISKDHHLLTVNSSFCNFLGKREEDVIGKPCFEVIHSQDVLPLFCPLCGLSLNSYCEPTKVQGIYVKEFYEPLLKKYLRVTIIPLIEDEGVNSFLHYIEDITEGNILAKLSEALIEEYPGLFFINDENYNLLYVNKSFKSLSGEEKGKCYEILYGFDKPCEHCPMKVDIEEGVKEVYSPKLKSYFKRFFKKISLSPDKVYKITYYIDITEEVERFERVPIALVRTTKEGEILRANARAKELFEIDTQEEISQFLAPHFWENPKEREHFLEKLMKEGSVANLEVRLRTKKGKPFYALLSSNLSEEKGSPIINIAVENIDEYVTEKEKAFKFLHQVLEFLPAGVSIINKEGRCIFANERLSKLTGYTVEELIGSDLHSLLIVEESVKKRAKEGFRKIALGEPSKLTRKFIEFIAKKKDGKIFFAEIYFDEVFLEGERSFIGIIQDITERKVLEEKILREEKIIMIERIAGGLAHDLNNLLMIAKGYLELLEERTKGYGERERNYVQKVKEVFEKMFHLVLELFILSQGDIKKEEFIEVSSFIREWVP